MIGNNKVNPVSTVLVLIIALTILYLLYSKVELLYLSILLGIISISSSKITLYIHRTWMGIAKILSYIVPNILLTLIFFLILLPLSLFSKLFRNSDLLNIKKAPDSLWIKHDRIFSKDYFEKPW